MKALRHEPGRRPLTRVDRHGTSRIVVCLPSDTVDFATQRVAAAGGAATVVVPHEGFLVPLSWVLQISHQETMLAEDGIHPGSTLGMLVEYLNTSEIAHMSFQVTTGMGDVDVTEGERLTIPA